MPDISTSARPAVSDLAGYAVDAQRGFVPTDDPLPSLDPRYQPWERLARDISALIMTGRLRAAVAAMPEFRLDGLSTTAERERAMLLLSCLGNAYVWAEPEPAHRLPATLAVPWSRLAASLDRPPIVTHSSIVLNNWRRLAPDEPLTMSNIDTQLTFLGGVDEKWFYLATVGVELAGAPALPKLVDAQHAIAEDNQDRLTADLYAIEAIVRSTTRALLDIERWCDPHVFYHRIRPFLTGWPDPGLIYEGVDETPRLLTGGSAAQSSLIQAFDAGLRIPHQHEMTGSFLRAMRAYMPLPHRRFLADLEAGPSIFDYVTTRRGEHPRLADAYNACVRAVGDLRAQHLGLTGRYINRFERGEDRARGTGGTDFTKMLVQSREETRARELR